MFSAPVIRKKRGEKAVKKPRAIVNPEKLQQVMAQHHMDAFNERSEDDSQDELMDKIKYIHASVKAQASVPGVPTRILQTPEKFQPPVTTILPFTRKVKTRKMQELVQARMPKRTDPVRGMESKTQFEISKILDTPIVLKIGEFLEYSDIAIEELVCSMQRSMLRY